jgi:ketosteroid isomerase-like protein
MADRPTLALDDDPRAVEEFVAGVQAAVDAWAADGLNRQLADDVLWGSPFGAVVSGYDKIHAIHSQMHAAASERQAQGQGGGSRYEIEHAPLVAEGTAIAYVRRFSLAERGERGEEQPGRADARACPVRARPPGRSLVARRRTPCSRPARCLSVTGHRRRGKTLSRRGTDALLSAFSLTSSGGSGRRVIKMRDA